MSKRIYVSYEHIHGLVEKRADLIHAFNPDTIVAIGGGGFIPARLVRTQHKSKMIGVVVERYMDTEETHDPVKAQWLDTHAEAHVRGKRVLVVDDLDDTRETLAYVVQELAAWEPAAVGVFVLHNKIKAKSAILPANVTYIEGQSVPDQWIVYPWEAHTYGEHQTKEVDFVADGEWDTPLF